MRSRATCRKPADSYRPTAASSRWLEPRKSEAAPSARARSIAAFIGRDGHLGELEDAVAGRLERDAADHAAVLVAGEQHVAARLDVVPERVGDRLAVLRLEV